MADRIQRIRILGANAARSRDINIALHHKIPSLLAEGKYAVADMASLLNRDFLIACGETAPHNVDVGAFCPVVTRPMIADLLVRDIARRGRNMTHDQSIAFRLTMLSGIPLNCMPATLDDVQAARRRVLTTLRLNPPSIAEVARAIGLLIADLRKYNVGDIQQGETAERVIDGWNPNNECSAQKYLFYANCAQHFPLTMFVNEQMQVVWQHLADINTGYVELMDLDLDQTINEEHFVLLWRDLTQNEMIGILTMIALSKQPEMLSYIYAANFAYVAVLGKETFTTAWVDKRVRMLNDMSVMVDINPIMKASVLHEYVRLNPKHDINEEDFYNKLVAVMTLADRGNMNPLIWIIEQSALGNVTHATIIAINVAKMKYFDIDIFINYGVPETDIIQFLTLLLQLMRCPFSSLLALPINVAKYANLAYIMLYLSKNLLKESTMGGYAGNPLPQCALSKNHMEELARRFFEIHQQLEMPDFDLVSLVNERKTGDEGEVVEIQQQLFTVGNALRRGLNPGEAREHVLAIARAANPAARAELGRQDLVVNNALEQPLDINVEEEDAPVRVDDNAVIAEERAQRLRQRRLMIRTRQAWPRQAKNLPNGSTHITQARLGERFKSGQSPRSYAFNAICAEYTTLTKQTSQPRIGPTALNAPSLRKQISEDMVLYYRLWGINVPDDYRNAIPAYAPNNENDNPPIVNRYVYRYEGKHRDNVDVPVVEQQVGEQQHEEPREDLPENVVAPEP